MDTYKLYHYLVMYKMFLAIMLSKLLDVQRLKAVFIYNIVALHLKSMFLLALFVSNVPSY